jgi:integrase
LVGRPGLALGAWGSISISPDPVKFPKANTYRALAMYRDRYTGAKGQVTASGNTGPKAEAALSEKLRARSAGGAATGSTALTSESTMRHLAAHYLASLDSGNVASGTKTRYRRTVELKVIPALGGLRLRELSSGKFTAAIAKEAKRSPSEAKIMRAVCNGMMRLALMHDAVSTNHALGSALDLKDPHKKPPRALSPEDAVGLFDLIDAARTAAKPGPVVRKGLDDLRDALLLGLATGLRISEITAIHDEDIVWGDPVRIKVHRANVYQEGTGLKTGPGQWEHPGGQVIQSHTKTKDRRLVAVDEFGAAILKRRIGNAGQNGLLFWARGTRGPISLNNLRRVLRRVTGETALDFVSTHTMRRSLATAVQRELGVEVAQQVLAHDELSTTIRGYIARETTTPDVREISRKFGRADV